MRQMAHLDILTNESIHQKKFENTNQILKYMEPYIDRRRICRVGEPIAATGSSLSANE